MQERALEEAKQHQILEEKEKAEKALKHIEGRFVYQSFYHTNLIYKH